MMQSLDFVYNGISSKDMGVIQINSNSGLFEEQFVASKTINEEKIRGRDRPYLFSVDYSPLSFSLTLYFGDKFTDEQARKVARWLRQDYYKPFYTLDNPERVFYCMTTDDFNISHNGLGQGYITLNMRCNSPYAYSPYYEDIMDFTNNTISGSSFKVSNLGDIETYPEIWIKAKQDGDISIVNTSNGGTELKFTNLFVDETVYVDNENEDIETDFSNTYRFDDHNGVYLSLVYGVNSLHVYGKCEIKIKYRYKYLLGF